MLTNRPGMCILKKISLEHKVMKKVVITVSYGSGHAEKYTKEVTPLAAGIEKAFGDWACIHAYANARYVSMLRDKGMNVYHYTQALETVAEKGFDSVCIVPLLLTRGKVYGEIVKAAGDFYVSAPLMDSESDFLHVAKIYEKIAMDSGRDVILMGHGSADESDRSYLRLAEVLDDHVHIACLKGQPEFQSILFRLSTERQILLMPLMVAAGRHAHEDMSGAGRDSWKTVLEGKGFDVQVRLEGLGELPGIQDLFIRKAKAAAGQYI